MDQAGRDVRLFSFGTLQDPAVQRGVFGRSLTGQPDVLPGYRIEFLTITDPAVLALSGASEHPLLQPSNDPADQVTGTVYDLTAAELRAADAYEVADYGRVSVTLTSGRTAWVYLDRQHLDGRPYRPEI